MTAAAYSWPRFSGLTNGDFAAGAGTTFTDWTNSGTVNELATGGVGGTRAPELEGSATIYQDKALASGSGRNIDRFHDQRLSFYGKVTAGTVTGVQVRALLYNGSSTLLYYYDFYAGEWKAIGTYTATTAPYFGIYPNASLDWTIYNLPRILAPAEAGSDVAESYKIRVAFTNASSGGSANKFGVDDVVLSPYQGATRVLPPLGRFMVCYNGLNYPVKYDLRTGGVTELSLPPPYHTANSALPTVTSLNSTGSLTESHYYGFLYIFQNNANGERSGTPYGVALSSAYYTQQVGAGHDTITHDFSAIELPNAEDDRDTDNDEITHIQVFRTLGYADIEQATRDLEAGLVYYEGTVAINATHTSTLTDENLLKQGALSDYIADPTAAPMPNFDVACIWRDRLWVSGGPEYRLGFVNVTQNSAFVEGNDEGSTAPYTRWGRGITGYTFRLSGSSTDYDVESYIYPDDYSTNNEGVFLTEQFREASGSTQDYIARPKNGRVVFSEEGKPYATGFSNIILLDGDQSAKVTMLVPAGNNLVMATRRDTYAMNYGAEPLDSGGVAASIRRGVGCIGRESAAECEGFAFWLSDEGIVRSNGQSAEIISHHLRRIFTDREDADYIVRRRNNGMAVDAYGVCYEARHQYLLAVRTRSGRQGANLVIVYNYLLDSWDLYRVPCGISKWSKGEDDKGNPVLLFSDPYGGLWKWDIGYVDGAGENNNHGKLKGRFVSTDTLTDVLSDTAVLFTASHSNNFSSATLGLENAVVRIVSGAGEGQERRIVRATGTTIYRDAPWDTAPDTDSVWEIGSIPCLLKLKASDFGARGAIKRLKQLGVDYDRESLGGSVLVEAFSDDNDASRQDMNGVAGKPFTTAGSGRAMVGLDDAAGYLVRITLDASGAENPLRIRGLSLVYVKGEDDA